MNKEFTDLVQEFLADGIISAKERAVLLKKAEKLGIDVDEADLYIDAQQQKEDMNTAMAEKKKKGKACPFCGGAINDLVDKCPHCGGNITPEATRELQEILDNLEDALVAFKAGKNIAEAKALVERYARKAKLYYSNNAKVTFLLEEIKKEVEAADAKAKKQAVLNALARKWKLIAGVVAVIVLVVVIKIAIRPTPANDAATCVEAVQQAIKRGDMSQAEAYCTSFASRGNQGWGDIESAIYSVAEAYIAAGEFEEAERFCTTYNLFGNRYSSAKPIAFKLQNHYIKLGKYDEAEKCIDYYGCTNEYFDFLCKCLDHILENEGRAKAKSFISRKIGHYHSRLTNKAEWQQNVVKSRLYQYAGIR